MMNLQEQLEMARKAGIENWIDPNNSNRGWYTCLLTNKKFRGQQAEDLITRQDVLVNEWNHENAGLKDSMDYELDVRQEIERQAEETEANEEGTRKAPKQLAVPVMVEFQGQTLTVQATPTLVVHKMTGSEKHIKTTIINCIDCGAPRQIKVQDIFQVKRCPHCQAEYRKAQRRAKYKAKKEAECQTKEPKELLSVQQQIELMAQQGTLFQD